MRPESIEYTFVPVIPLELLQKAEIRSPSVPIPDPKKTIPGNRNIHNPLKEFL
jgi:hypothetical protein